MVTMEPFSLELMSSCGGFNEWNLSGDGERERKSLTWGGVKQGMGLGMEHTAEPGLMGLWEELAAV